MATYFVASGGSNTAPYDTWAKAATSLQTALTAASANGDVIAIQSNGVPAGDAEIAADTTYTFAASVSLISSTNSGTATITPTEMGTGAWIGNSTTNRSVTMTAPNRRVFVYGLTLRTSGVTLDIISLAAGDGAHFEYENCYFWNGNTATTGSIFFGGGVDVNTFSKAKNCTFRFGATAQGIQISGRCVIDGGSISASGSAITSVFRSYGGADGNATDCRVEGMDLTGASSSATILADSTLVPFTLFLSRCKMPSAFTALASQTNANRSSAELFILDCASDDTHGLFGYHNALGSVVSSTGTYLTAGAAGQSWQITTTSSCSFGTPFVTPWINLYSAAASAATYKLELLRNNGTATAYTDAQVWGEFSIKDNSGFTNADLFNDRQSLTDWAAGTAGTAQTAGTGTGSWTIAASSSPASFVVDSGSAVAVAENGDIRARVVVGLASVSSLFLDPQIRT